MDTRSQVEIDGIIPIVPTPFDEDERIDFGELRRLLDFACATDACAACTPAYASEFYKLSDSERREIIAAAAEHLGARLPLVAQANSVSAVEAAALARFAERAGASVIAVAAPRVFATGEHDLLRYFDRILSAIDTPVLIQDYNPGGATISPSFICELHRMHPHFRWVKLEEPMMAARVHAILDEASGEVGVLEGWGGMYLLELVSAGICGVMPGLGLADLLGRAYRLARAGRKPEAYEIFRGVLPQIVFSLQNMELYHHAEKQLLARRGVLRTTTVRSLRIGLAADDAEHIEFLNDNILEVLDRMNLPHCPLPDSVGIDLD